MKIHVTKSYLDMARSVIDTTLYGDKEETIGEDALFSLMSCTYVFSFMALTSFCSSHLHSIWIVENSKLREKYSHCPSFEALMAGPLKEIKLALRELCTQLGIKKLHLARPKAWRELNELLKGYRDYFIHPNPEYFHTHMEATGNLKWDFPSSVAAEIISYFFIATQKPVPEWVNTSGLQSKGFKVVNTEGSAMSYWRMQLHPSESVGAIKHTVESLSAGYIGLDFSVDIPDLMTVSQSVLPENQRNYWAFAHEMKVGDHVLIFVHHYPFALVKVSGEYNYIRSAVPELGVWFRHFRAVEDIRYFGDFITDARTWEPITMTATITPLRKADTESHQLIERWLSGTA